MITKYNKFVLSDENKEKDFFIEVNWDEKNDKSNHCKLLKVTFPDNTHAVIKKELLNSLLFVIGTEEEQRKLLPQKLIHTRVFNKMIEITAKKDIMKGEKIRAELSFTLPSEEEEIIGSLDIEKLKKNKVVTNTGQIAVSKK